MVTARDLGRVSGGHAFCGRGWHRQLTLQCTHQKHLRLAKLDGGLCRSLTPLPRRSPSVQEPRSPSPAESVESGEIPGGPDATAGGLDTAASARLPNRSPDNGPAGR